MMGRATVPQARWYGVQILVGTEYFFRFKIILAGHEVNHLQTSSADVRVQLFPEGNVTRAGPSWPVLRI